MRQGPKMSRGMRLARIAANKTLEQLSGATGISVSQLSRYESEKKFPRLDELRRIAAFLKVNVRALVEDGHGPVKVDDGDASPLLIDAPSIDPVNFYQIAINETLLATGVREDLASELAAMIEQVALANPPGFPGMSAEETTRMIVRRRVEKILASLPTQTR